MKQETQKQQERGASVIMEIMKCLMDSDNPFVLPFVAMFAAPLVFLLLALIALVVLSI